MNKVSPTVFNDAAKETIKDNYLKERTLNDNNKLSIRYNDEGTIPQGLSFLQDGLTYDDKDKKWKDTQGNIVDNPFTKEYGFTDVARDWNSWGYIDKEGNWHSVDAPQPSTSGNTDYKFTPSAEWAKDLGDAKSYEQQEEYLNNYADFIEALNKGDQAALQRLYVLGEATKSNNPKEREGKNRYFREDADFDNLKKEDVIGYDPNNPRGGIFGNSYYTDAFGIESPYSKDYKFVVSNKDGSLLRIGSKTWNSLSDEEKKEYTQIEGPLTREHLMNNLKWAVNQYPEAWKSDVSDLYLQGISDNEWGPHHLMANQGTKRYALVDNQGNYRRDADNNIRYINFDPNASYQYYNEGKPLEGQSQFINGVNVDTIGVLGGNVENNIGVKRNPDGTWKTYDLTDDQVAKLKSREILSTDERYATLPQFENAVEGYTFIPHYYELDDDAYKSIGLNIDNLNEPEKNHEKDPFPKASVWPYAVGAGLQAGSLLYNILKPSDYSNAEALIQAAKQAGTYTPVAFRPVGEYLKYNPFDINYTANQLRASERANARALANNSNGNIGMLNGSLLANNYNNQIALGNAYRQAFEYNDAQRAKTAEFNRGTDEFNSEGFLKADMANQDAATRTAGYKLEGLKSGYAMKQAIDDARANAISAGLSGLANLAFTYGQQKDYENLLKWRTRRGVDGPGIYYKGEEGNAAKGGKLRRVHKGLSF